MKQLFALFMFFCASVAVTPLYAQSGSDKDLEEEEEIPLSILFDGMRDGRSLILPVQAYLCGECVVIETIGNVPFIDISITCQPTGEVIYQTVDLVIGSYSIPLDNAEKGNYLLRILVEDKLYIGHFEL